MESQNPQQQLTDDMQNEMIDSLNNSATLENEGNSLELDYSCNADEIESKDAVEEEKVQHLTGVIPSQKQLQKTCWYDEDGNRVCI
ncbi:MAG: hypothetical protein KME59_14785 [Trichormus sp. ATA11-4-KO1]|jgi:hypothetical protein|nr:hypothetical protein [Trichormus sp. ATA11-4-KO1]